MIVSGGNKGANLVQTVNGGAVDENLVHPVLRSATSERSTTPHIAPAQEDIDIARYSILVAEGQDETTGRWNFRLSATSHMAFEPDAS